MRSLGSLSPEERKETGAKLNLLKDKISDAINARKAALKETAIEARLRSEKVDITLPIRPSARAPSIR
jgi:phenylalanyl-tRNA synthetase alpha chain